MKILELNIEEFGGLQKRVVAFDKGINLLFGENESGKSTCFLFIKFILYGLPGRKGANGNEREYSLSREGHRAAGSMRLEARGKVWLIRRSCVDCGARKVSEELRIICCDENREYTFEREPGEEFLGIPREIFEGTCAAGQMRCGELGGSRITEKMENMMTSADEDADVVKALKRLDEARRFYRYKSGNGGEIDRLSRKLDEERGKLEGAKRQAEELAELAQKEKELNAEYDMAQKCYDRADRLERQENALRLLKDFGRLHDCTALLKENEADQQRLCKNELITDFIPDRAYLSEISNLSSATDEAEKKAKEAVGKAEILRSEANVESSMSEVAVKLEKNGGRDAVLEEWNRKKKRKKNMHWTAVSGLAVSLLGGLLILLSSVLSGVFPRVYVYLGMGTVVAGLAMAVTGMVCRSHAVLEIKKLLAAYSADESDFPAYLACCARELDTVRRCRNELVRAEAEEKAAWQNFEDAFDRLGKCLARIDFPVPREDWRGVVKRKQNCLSVFCSKYEFIEQKRVNLQAQVTNLSDSLREYDEAELKKTFPEGTEAADAGARAKASEDKEKFRNILIRLDRQKKECSQRHAELNATHESPLAIADRIQNLKEELSEATEICDSLILAHSTMEEADAYIRSHVSPALGKRAGELVEKATGGRYQSLMTGDHLELSLTMEDIPVKEPLLSGGTRDIAYLALRIALMEQLCPEELPPLIMDEALCQADDHRTGNMLEALAKLAEDGVQCLIFTCHVREAQICERLALPHCLICLEKEN